jgi:hypothetical protein
MIAVYVLQPSYAQDLQVFKSADKYGYEDESGNIVISPQFANADEFSEGLAAVELNGKFGYINKDGSFVIQPQFEGRGKFINGIAGVKLNGKWGYIDRTGDFIIRPQYELCTSFSTIGLAGARVNSKWGFVDKAGKFIIQPQYELCTSFSFIGLAGVKANSKWGYIDKTGEFIIKPRFDYASAFTEDGLAIVKLNGGYGFIDKTGEFVIKPQFDHLEPFSNGMATAKLNGKYGYIDKFGKFVIKLQFEEASSFTKNRRYAQVKLNGTTGYIDDYGDFYSSKEQLLAVNKYLNKKPMEDESYIDYMKRIIPSWDDYLQRKNVIKPTGLSVENVKQVVELEVNAWQRKGEFESSSEWKKRVNERTRAAKIKEVTARIQADYSKKIKEYNAQIANAKSDYEAEYCKASDRYCIAKAHFFTQQTFDLKPYDADNATYLITTEHDGDILLPVPRKSAREFKENWENIESNIQAEFVPIGDDVALKSVTFGDYTYDGNTKANYALTTIDYHFAPIEISNLDLTSVNYDFDHLSSTPTVTISNPNISTIQPTKVIPQDNHFSIGINCDVDVNIPKCKNTAKNTFAIVIANENYQNVQRVENAANDGKIVAQYLTSTLGIPQGQVIFYTDASYGNMIDALDRIKNISQAYHGDDYNVVFYYAGHGVPDDQSHETYLLPVDGKPGSTAVNIPLSKLYSTLGKLGASSVLVMLDACFSGSQRGNGMLTETRGVAIKAKAAEPQGNMIVLTAAQGDETAYPYRGKNHGMFTYYLLKKLQESSGNVTIGELADYVIDNVKKTSVLENNGKIQTPTIRASVSCGESWRNNKLVK